MGLKLGVYIATHNSPVFLRSCLSQLSFQRQKPSVVVIHQNGEGDRYDWVIQEFADLFGFIGVQVEYIHTQRKLQHPEFHRPALKRLLELECDLFTKWDHDDLFYHNHLETLVSKLGEADCVVNMQADVLEAYPGKPHKFRPNLRWYWNPTGGPSDGVLFNRKFAEVYYHFMSAENAKGKPDDVIMASVMNLMKTNRLLDPSTMCYVGHGSNTSGVLLHNYVYQKVVTSAII